MVENIIQQLENTENERKFAVHIFCKDEDQMIEVLNKWNKTLRESVEELLK